MKKILLSVAAIAIFGSVNAQVYTATDSVDFAGWNFVDLDADGHNWSAMEWAGSGSWYEAAGGAMNSYSYDNATASPLTPDNLAVSPVIDLTGSVGVTLTWSAGTGETTASGWHEEHYAVYVVTDFAPLLLGTYPTPVFETTLADGETLYNESVDITAQAAGSATVYVVFRHFNCTDEFTLMVDDVNVYGAFASTDENELTVTTFPNPATDVLNISLNQPANNVAVYSMDGQMIINEQVNSTTVTVDVAGLTAGMYLYEVTTADGLRSRSTFVKK